MAAQLKDLQPDTCGSCTNIGKTPFCSLSTQAQILVSTSCEIKTMYPNNYLWDGLVPNDNIYIIRRGFIKMYTEYEGRESLELIYPGTMFGGHMYAADKKFKSKPLVSSQSEVCIVDSSVFAKLVQAQDRFIQSYNLAMALYMSSLRASVQEVAGTKLIYRLARALQTDLAKRGQVVNGKITVDKVLSQEDWALHLSARRESISRAFKHIEDLGVIYVGRDRITLNNEFLLLKLIADESKT